MVITLEAPSAVSVGLCLAHVAGTSGSAEVSPHSGQIVESSLLPSTMQVCRACNFFWRPHICPRYRGCQGRRARTAACGDTGRPCPHFSNVLRMRQVVRGDRLIGRRATVDRGLCRSRVRAGARGPPLAQAATRAVAAGVRPCRGPGTELREGPDLCCDRPLAEFPSLEPSMGNEPPGPRTGGVDKVRDHAEWDTRSTIHRPVGTYTSKHAQSGHKPKSATKR